MSLWIKMGTVWFIWLILSIVGCWQTLQTATCLQQTCEDYLQYGWFHLQNSKVCTKGCAKDSHLQDNYHFWRALEVSHISLCSNIAEKHKWDKCEPAVFNKIHNLPFLQFSWCMFTLNLIVNFLCLQCCKYFIRT